MAFSKIRLVAIATVVALPHVANAGEGTSAWHFDYIHNLTVGRLDPVVSPNEPSGHVHNIYGGSNFAAAYSYQNSEIIGKYAGLSSDDVDGLLSTLVLTFFSFPNRAPVLYATEQDANSATNKYTLVHSDQRYYAFLDRNAKDEPVEAYPEGLRFVVGNMSAKSYADTGLPLEALTYTCQSPGAPVEQNVLSDHFNFDRHCPELKVELRAPSCWDGKNLYLSNNSHMAYPRRVLYGPCPFSHPHRVPAIQFEWTHKVGEILPGSKPFKNRLIWAHGDTTGYGFHADMTMGKWDPRARILGPSHPNLLCIPPPGIGWDRDVLTKALNDPRCLPGYSIPAEECPSLGISKEADIERARSCRPAHGHVNETGTTSKETVDRLPGCNLPWKSGPKPTCSEPATLPDITSFLGVAADPLVVPGSTERVVKAAGKPKDTWERVGCLDEYVFDIGNKTGWHEYNTMTNQRCHDFCSDIGSPYAATNGGNRCRCALKMNTASYRLADEKCEGKCTVEGPKQPKESDKSYAGCFNSGSIEGHRSPTPEDVDTCRAHCKGFKYYGIAAGKYCDCSNEILAPGGIETRFPEFLCSSPCLTKPEQMCGGNPYGTFYQSVYLVDGTFEPKQAVGSVTTTFSSVPTTTGGSSETGPAVVGNALHLAATSNATVISTASRGVASAKLPGVVNMVTATDAGIGLSVPASHGIAALTSTSQRHHHHAACSTMTKTVTVTKTATPTIKASDISKRHLLRRSRQHMFDLFN
ncbi:hypothetical protein QFC19_000602 [Naganishia cerealis]|uniref:Uncharacterized protein n=1 Tax=Naganishia cerealis TaxID=610337 RepID=A0ACC2WLH1_9TREE|nr:hypothetical protein QFC19_000602 [Naganishia cerealis]